MRWGRRGALVAAAILGFVGVIDGAAAQNYPSRPVRVVLPFPPGGAIDALVRPISQRFQELTGHPFVVDNRPGAGGNLGPEIAASAAPDGYTLLVIPTSGYAIATALYEKLNYDLLRDFVPITMMATNPHVLVVHPSVPAKTVGELIALATAKPGQITVASQGVGTVSHLEGELFRSMAKIEWLHVPYKGSTPALADLTGGQVQVFFDSIAASRPHVLAGRTRALAVTPAQRTGVWPEIPTIAESGLPGYAGLTYFAMVAPAGTPKDIVAMLNKTLVQILGEPAMKERLVAAGLEPMSSTPEAVVENLHAEIAKWAPLVKASGAKPE